MGNLARETRPTEVYIITSMMIFAGSVSLISAGHRLYHLNEYFI